METGSEEVDLKEEVKFEVVSNVCAGDHGLYCVCGINGGEEGASDNSGQKTNLRNALRK